MRKLLHYLIAFILTCTVDRVAHFFAAYLGASVPQAWGFAVSIAVGVWICSWLTREHVTAKAAKRGAVKSRGVILSDEIRKQARFVLVVLIIGDGIFNLSDVLMGFTKDTAPLLYAVGALYGAFPTIVAALLGKLQGAVDRLPAGAKRDTPIVSDLVSGADAWAKRWAAQMRKKPAPPAVVSVPLAPLYGCSRCTKDGREWHSDATKNPKNQQAQHAGHIGQHAKADARVKA